MKFDMQDTTNKDENSFIIAQEHSNEASPDHQVNSDEFQVTNVSLSNKSNHITNELKFCFINN